MLLKLTLKGLAMRRLRFRNLIDPLRGVLFASATASRQVIRKLSRI